MGRGVSAGYGLPVGCGLPARPTAPLLSLIAVAVVLIAAGPAPAGALGRGETEQDTAQMLRDELTPEELVWRYSLGVVIAEEHDPADRLLLGSYVRILEDAVGDAPLRYLTAAERHALADRILRRERQRVLLALDDRVQSLDRSRLESGGPRPELQWEADSRYRELRGRVRILDLIQPRQFVLPETARLEQVREEHVYRRALTGMTAAADLAEAEQLFYLTVVPVEDLLFLRIRSFNGLTGTDREIARVVATAEEMPRRLEDLGSLLVSEIAGRSLADLSVQITDSAGMPEEGARIRVNESLIGLGRGEERFLLPGEYRISAATGDGRRAETTVTLIGGERREVLLELPPFTAGMIRIESEPPGARVYLGALWNGVTPLEVPRPAQTREFTISMDGHYDSRVQLGPESPDRVRRTLVATDTDWVGAVKETRNRFYRSFGAFALSLSAPILLNGMYQNLGGLFPGGLARSDLTAAEQEKYLRQANNVLTGYYISFGLSTTLFGNMVWRLTQYIRTAQEYHYR